MNTVDNDLSATAARQVIAEVDQASNMADQALDDSRPAPVAGSVDAQVIGSVEAANVELLRNRAKRQRARGIESLQRRHDGVASIVTQVQLNERVVASAFERFFATIETGIHVITKSGAMFVGDAQAQKLEQAIIERVAEMEARIDGEIARTRVALGVHQSRSDWLKPVYTKPAADHEVQLRSRLANRVLAVFRKQDEYVVMLQQMVWNDEADQDAVEMEELAIKKEMRGLAQFIRRTLNGMRNKVAAKDAPAAAEDGATNAEQLAA